MYKYTRAALSWSLLTSRLYCRFWNLTKSACRKTR